MRSRQAPVPPGRYRRRRHDRQPLHPPGSPVRVRAGGPSVRSERPAATHRDDAHLRGRGEFGLGCGRLGVGGERLWSRRRACCVRRSASMARLDLTGQQHPWSRAGTTSSYTRQALARSGRAILPTGPLGSGCLIVVPRSSDGCSGGCRASYRMHSVRARDHTCGFEASEGPALRTEVTDGERRCSASVSRPPLSLPLRRQR